MQDYLNYQEDDKSVRDVAARAARVLDAVHQSCPTVTKYLWQPSNLLAIGGLRAMSPYASFGNDQAAIDFEAVNADIADFGLRFVRVEPVLQKNVADEPVYFLFNESCLTNILKTYPGARTWWPGPPMKLESLYIDSWHAEITGALAGLMTENKLPKEWLAHWWAPHDIWFGMMLGYPGQAIFSSVESWARYITSDVEPAVNDIEFEYPVVVDAPEVLYYVQTRHRALKQIANHQRRWQAYFDAIYSRT